MTSAATSRHSSGESSDYRRPRGSGLDVTALYALCVYGSRDNLGIRRAA
jgi:hypothetical protein